MLSPAQLEYIYRRPKFLVTCIYGLLFIVLGNLSGNAIGFGSYAMKAAGYQGNDAAVRGLAIVVLTAACLLHALWRKGGILVNNAFAFFKVAILLLIIGTGLAALGGASYASGPIQTGNFDAHTSFVHPRRDMGSYVKSLLYALYPYGGYLQPFYVSNNGPLSSNFSTLIHLLQVLSEVSRPRKVFAKATIGAMVSVLVLYMLVNIAFVRPPMMLYFC